MFSPVIIKNNNAVQTQHLLRRKRVAANMLIHVRSIDVHQLTRPRRHMIGDQRRQPADDLRKFIMKGRVLRLKLSL